jgi:hypothetical protein
MRQTLAGYMSYAGQNDQADQVYQQLVQQSRGGPQEAGMLSSYAQYLAQTKRVAQADSMLQDYLAGGPSLEPWQKANTLYTLANVARQAGDTKRADKYQSEGLAAQQPQPPPAIRTRFAEVFQNLQTALNEHRLDDAFGLALDAIDAASRAFEGQQIQWQVYNLASQLAQKKETAKGERLFDRMLSRSQDLSVENMQPLILATQSYAQFLMNQTNRVGEVPAAIERYNKVLTDANGPDSGSLAQPLRLKLDFESTHSQRQNADATARDLLELQESLSGNTSEPYFNDLQKVARLYANASDFARALPLFREAIALSDLLATPPNSGRPSQTRLEAALALARAGQFDEAETLCQEAMTLNGTVNSQVQQLPWQAREIRRLKQAAAAAAARGIDP